MAIPFVGKRFTIKEFQAELGKIQFSTFKPEFIVLHHTGNPSLELRPDGFSEQHLQNLLHYYQETMGWSGAPHIFIDDRADGIIVFQKLTAKGVHAASFNSMSWGIEMLGNYDIESFDSERGAKVRDLTMQCLAAMCNRLDIGPETIRFHRDDPKTNKSCPGLNVNKIDVVSRVSKIMKKPLIVDISANESEEWTVRLKSGVHIQPVHVKDGRPILKIRDVINQLKPGGTFKAGPNASQVKWISKSGTVKLISIAQIDERGVGWAFVRDICSATGLGFKATGKRVEILA